ncbi:MAG TPA: hypothetical protein VD833_18245 [Vicinamibacterales bacterium]|nr:hypothetical protein [Vicinamibacterales bacterium]
MKSRLILAAGAAGVAITLSGSLRAAPGAQEKTMPLPVRLSAFAVNMSTVAPGTTAVMDINITRWTTPEEREKLITTAVEKRPDDLLRALQKMPRHGRIRIPGWVGPDPHNARLGWDLHYTWNTPGEDGGQRIVIATDRYIGFWEARNQPRTMDYPFMLIEIRLDSSGKGVGKMAVATKIEFNKETKTMVLENYSSEPVRLNEVKIEK